MVGQQVACQHSYISRWPITFSDGARELQPPARESHDRAGPLKKDSQHPNYLKYLTNGLPRAPDAKNPGEREPTA